MCMLWWSSSSRALFKRGCGIVGEQGLFPNMGLISLTNICGDPLLLILFKHSPLVARVKVSIADASLYMSFLGSYQI